jgi:hypothetical protein
MPTISACILLAIIPTPLKIWNSPIYTSKYFDVWYKGIAHLVRPLASMASHMIPHFAEFHTSVVAYRTLVGFLVSVFVPNGPYQFTCGR